MARATEKERILVVDDVPDTLEVIQRTLAPEGYRVLTASSVVEAIKILDQAAVDLVVTDLKMPKVGGLDLVRYVRENCEDTEVMMITGYGTIRGAVEAVKTGAEDYLLKPFTDQELIGAVRGALDKLHMRRAARPRPARAMQDSYGLLGESEARHQILGAK